MMKSQAFNSLHFPALPAHQYLTAPIYIEPMIGSGERLTIAGAVSNKKETLIEKLILPDLAEAMYGKQGKNILGLADLIIQDLQEHLKTGNLPDWQPCFEGAYLGTVSNARADNPRHALSQIARLHSSLCKLSALKALDEDEPEEPIMKDNTLSAWVKQVQQLAATRSPDWRPCFNIKENLAQGDLVTLHFAYDTFAANIGLITPVQLSSRINDAKIKLWNLDHLPKTYREKRLILGIPREDAPEMADDRVKNKVLGKIEALQEEAQRCSIDVKTAHTAQAAAQLLAA